MDTRRVVVVRHAKAESGEEGSDHARRLTARGRRDAASTGQWLADRLDRVDRVWVSSAARAKETWEAMADRLPEPGQLDVDRRLYQAGSADIVAWATSTDVPVSVVVGHNPTMEDALRALTGDLRGLRTSAAAIVELSGDRGRLAEHFEPPR